MNNKNILSKVTSELNKTKSLSKPRDIIYDPMGQWKYPGQPTRIPSNNITMDGVPYPVMAYPNIGEPELMYPGQDYNFPEADYVDEYPELRKGGLVRMPKPSKKGLSSKAYSRSLDATNRLYTENNLFKKPKSRRNKVFDPNAKYYQDGGEYVELELTPEEIEEYAKGGYIIEDISVPELTQAQKGKTVKPLYIADPEEYAYRKQMYDDSLSLYNNYIDLTTSLNAKGYKKNGSAYNKKEVSKAKKELSTKISNTLNKVPDFVTGVINPKLPYQLYSNEIKPSTYLSYRKKLEGKEREASQSYKNNKIEPLPSSLHGWLFGTDDIRVVAKYDKKPTQPIEFKESFVKTSKKPTQPVTNKQPIENNTINTLPLLPLTQVQQSIQKITQPSLNNILQQTSVQQPVDNTKYAYRTQWQQTDKGLVPVRVPYSKLNSETKLWETMENKEPGYKDIRPKFENGGIVSKLSKKEIDDLVAQGYVVEEVD